MLNVRMLPGLGLAVLIMLVSLPLADAVGALLLTAQGIDPAQASSPISGVLAAIVVGIVWRNAAPMPEWLKPGLAFCVKSLLRLGIVLVGIKLSLLEALRLGVWGVPIVAATIGLGLWLVQWINRRLRLPRRLGILIAAGTSICGVTAIASVAPAIDADEKEVAYAIANITLFGLVGMFLYPYAAPLLLNTSEQIGLFLGMAIHETAQVVGAALTYKEVFGDDVAFQVATVAKLTRNLFLAAVVPILSIHYLRGDRGAKKRANVSLRQLIPHFVIGFLVMATLRTVGDATAANGAAFGLLDPDQWKAVVHQVGDVWGSEYALGVAMAAVGLGTSFSVFRGVGFKPFLVGFAGALLVGAVGLAMAWTLGSLARL